MYTSSNTNELQNGGYTEATFAVDKCIAFTSNSQKEEESGSWYNSMAPAVKLMIDNEKKLELELGFPTPTVSESLDRQVGVKPDNKVRREWEFRGHPILLESP